MAQRILINANNATDLMGTTAYGPSGVISVERDTSSAFSAPTVLGTVPLVSGQDQYEYWDGTGTSAHYYRTQFSGNSKLSSYSDVMQATALAAYAQLDDLLETMDIPTPGSNKLNLLADLLVDGTTYITDECDRSFFRSPQVSGTSVWTFDVIWSRFKSLSQAVGEMLDIVSVTTLEYATQSGGSFTTIAQGSTGYYLTPANPKAGWPYTDIVLSDLNTTQTQWEPGRQVVRLTGVRGFTSVPSMVKRATIDWAREMYRQATGAQALWAMPYSVRAVTDPQGVYVRGSYV